MKRLILAAVAVAVALVSIGGYAIGHSGGLGNLKKPWEAYCCVGGAYAFLGYFSTKALAVAARKSMLEAHGV